MPDDNYLKNFAMMIPLEPTKFEEDKPDPNGVPIYAGCPSDGLCACTGACRKILGYDTDPEKVRLYHESIEIRNKIMKKWREDLFKGEFTRDTENIRVWKFPEK